MATDILSATATFNRDIAPIIFEQFYALRALAMSADCLVRETSESDEALAVSHTLKILMEKAEDFANMLENHSINASNQNEVTA